MTPKEKAKQLLDSIRPLSDPINDEKYKDSMNRNINAVEICRMICDEVLSVRQSYFWMNVKQEIEKL